MDAYPYAAMARAIVDPLVRDRFIIKSHLFSRWADPPELLRDALRGPRAVQRAG